MPVLHATDPEVKSFPIFMLKRLSLWLAVGNAGGLVALGSQAIQLADKPVAGILLPGLWAFAIGLIGAFALQGALAMTFADDNDMSPFVETLGTWSTATTCLGFLIGVFYPLTMASITLFRIG